MSNKKNDSRKEEEEEDDDDDEKEDKVDHKEWIDELNKNQPKDFDENRKIGENNNIICKLIQKDLIKEFITHVNKADLSLDSTVEESIYETNSLLLKKSNLIEYAAFYGSIQIFNYLKINGAKLTSKLLLYAIHGQNSEIIHILEENEKLNDKQYIECINESIKCHHNDIYIYFQNNCNDKDVQCDVNSIALKYYNFSFIDYPKSSLFKQYCKYDYDIFVYFILKNEKIDIYKEFTMRNLFGDSDNFDDDDYSDGCEYDNERFNKMNYLIVAIKKENTEIVKLLLNKYKNINKEYETKMDIDVDKLVSYEKEIERIEENTEFFQSYNHNNGNFSLDHGMITFNAFYFAAKRGNSEIVKLFLRNDDLEIGKAMHCTYEMNEEQIYNESQTPLGAAVENEHLEVVKLIMNQKEFSNIFMINSFSWDDDEDKSSSTKSEEEKSEICIAIENNDIEMIKLLLKNPSININMPSSFSYQMEGEGDSTCMKIKETKFPLYMAIDNGNIEIVKLLLENESIDVNAISVVNINKSNENEKESYFITPLNYAIQKNNIEIVKYLIKHPDVKINLFSIYSKNDWGTINKISKSALYLAVEEKNIEIIKLLLEHPRINVNDSSINIKKEYKQLREKKNLY